MENNANTDDTTTADVEVTHQLRWGIEPEDLGGGLVRNVATLGLWQAYDADSWMIVTTTGFIVGNDGANLETSMTLFEESMLTKHGVAREQATILRP